MYDTTQSTDQPGTQTPERAGAEEAAAAAAAVATTNGSPLRNFRGTISVDGERVVLTAGGLKVEVLAADRVATDEESLARERARAREIFGRHDSRSVSLRGVQRGSYITGASIGGAEARPAARLVDDATRAKFAGVYQAIHDHRDALLKIDGVVSVRPGYRFVKGWITDEPAVVVTVLRKLDRNELAAGEIIPPSYGDVAVDVAPASPVEQLRAAASFGVESARAALSNLAQSPAELSVPLLAAAAEDAGGAEAAEAATEALSNIKYRPPGDGLALDEVTDAMTVTCHVSPDAGWPTLSEFFTRTSERLTIAMYDFTAPHILRGIRSAMSHAGGKLQLILGPGESLPKPDDTDSTKADDLPETKVLRRLRDALRARFQSTWASVGNPNGLFANSYHIKVAVRDGNSFWLSSGNWQSSNQPDLDPLGADSDVPGILDDYNREWHVIVEHPGLASMFERFIEWDIEQTRALPAPESATAAPPVTLPELLVPAPSAEALPRYFPPARMTFNSSKKLRVQPLLTPDNYAAEVLRLIESAEDKLYFQNQSIGFAKYNYADFLALIDAVRRKMDDGLDVRVILRGDFGPRVMLENLVARGFHASKVKFQPNCHTKGIIVDSRAVLVSSHNWTNSGTLFNRDAGLIFHDARIARYYEDIFLHDWQHLARHLLTQEIAAPVVAGLAGAAGTEAATPQGMVRVPWNVYYED